MIVAVPLQRLDTAVLDAEYSGLEPRLACLYCQKYSRSPGRRRREKNFRCELLRCVLKNLQGFDFVAANPTALAFHDLFEQRKVASQFDPACAVARGDL